MTRKLLNTAMGIALSLGITVPGYSATIFDFGGSTTGDVSGGVTLTAHSGGSLLAFYGAAIDSLFVNGAVSNNGSYTVTNGSLVFDSAKDILYLFGQITVGLNTFGVGYNGSSANTTGTNFASALETIALTGQPTYGASSATGSATINIANFSAGTSITSITESAALLSAFGETGATATFSSGGLNANNGTISGSSPNQTGSATADSQTLDFTLSSPAPEPVSFLLFGSGLLGVGLFARRRSVRN